MSERMRFCLLQLAGNSADTAPACALSWLTPDEAGGTALPLQLAGNAADTASAGITFTAVVGASGKSKMAASSLQLFMQYGTSHSSPG